jgi:hypothetical protein
MSWEDLINDEHTEWSPASSEYSAEARRWLFVTQHKDAIDKIAAKLGVPTHVSLSVMIGWGRAIVDHVRAGGRVVFVDANGRERTLKVSVKP